MAVNEIFGVVLLLLGFWQIYSTYGYVKDSKKHRHGSKSFFSMYAVFFSSLLTVLFLVSGLGVIFHIAIG